MRLTRRQVLRSAGVALALPCLDAFSPARASAAPAQPRRRMVCICAPLGLRPDNFFPEKSGKDYEFTPYLELIKDYRDDFTVISGLSHDTCSTGNARVSSPATSSRPDPVAANQLGLEPTTLSYCDCVTS